MTAGRPSPRSVQFRTTPADSSGAPHILEHTVLCGSQRYPCRDPFFKMLNRSLCTFMNAFTGEMLGPAELPRVRGPPPLPLSGWGAGTRGLWVDLPFSVTPQEGHVVADYKTWSLGERHLSFSGQGDSRFLGGHCREAQPLALASGC